MNQAAAQSAELAVFAGGDLELDQRAVGLGGGGAIFASARDPLRRSSQPPRYRGGEDFLRERHALRAKSAADVFREHADFFLLEAERTADHLAHAEDVLSRRPDLDAVAVGSCSHCAWLHG